jgi:hypothetical protein
MGRRPKPYRHSQTNNAVGIRRRREAAPVAKLCVNSQLLVTKRRIRKGTFAPPNEAVLRAIAERYVAEGQLVSDNDLRPDEEVSFLPPGPRASRALASGYFLCYPDAKQAFCAIDRRRRGDPKRLDNIFVVPATDVWYKA